MARLTYKNPDGSWGLLRVDWKSMGNLPPLVYGAMHKLMEMEELIEILNAPGSGRNGSGLLALEQLLTMGNRRENGREEGTSWILERFCRLN